MKTTEDGSLRCRGCLAYGATREQAIARAEALALRVIAERLENEEDVPDMANLFLVAA